MQYLPKETVDAWIRQGKHLDPKRLIPALVQYDQRSREQVWPVLECKKDIYIYKSETRMTANILKKEEDPNT